MARRATATRCSWRRRPASDRVRRLATELEESLTRLGVDHVDLIQLHNLVEPDEWEIAVRTRWRGRGARRGRATRGCAASSASPVTACESHAMHLRSLHAFDFDSVLLPYNFTHARAPRLPRRRRGAPRTVLRARGRRADHQVDRPRPLVGQPRGQVQLVRAVDRSGGDRPSGPVRARQRATASSTPPATRSLVPLVLAAARPATSWRPRPAELRDDVETFGITAAVRRRRRSSGSERASARSARRRRR